MKIVSWNIRGCNSRLKARILKRKIANEKPSIMMIQETKCSEECLRKLGEKIWRGSRTIGTDSIRAAGGVGIWWNPREVSLHNFVTTKYSISAEFHFIGTKIRGCLTNVYGPFKFAQK